jgi:hypothetical protein
MISEARKIERADAELHVRNAMMKFFAIRGRLQAGSVGENGSLFMIEMERCLKTLPGQDLRILVGAVHSISLPKIAAREGVELHWVERRLPAIFETVAVLLSERGI